MIITDSRQKHSLLYGENANKMHKFQRDICFDLKSAIKLMENANTDESRVALSRLVLILNDLREHMYRSRQKNGKRYYNLATERLDAMHEYDALYKGPDVREHASKGHMIPYTLIDCR